MRRFLRLSREVLLTVGAILGTACIVLAIVGAAYDVKPLIFRSGSMGPAIGAGALGLATPAAAPDLRVGDIVSVKSRGDRITHRIQEITVRGETAELTLKGDANQVPDARAYRVKSADRVFFDLPYAGYFVSYASGPVGLIVTGMLAAVLVWLVVRPARRGSTTSSGRRRRLPGGVGRGSGAALLLLGAMVLTGGTLRPVPTWASFSDQGTVNGGTLSAHTVASQSQPTCTEVNGLLGLGNVARLTWSQVNAKYEYYWELRTTGGSAVASGTVGSGTAQGGTVTLDISTGLIGTNANYNVVVRARLAGSTSWVAGSTTTTQVRRASVLIIGVSFRCGWA